MAKKTDPAFISHALAQLGAVACEVLDIPRLYMLAELPDVTISVLPADTESKDAVHLLLTAAFELAQTEFANEPQFAAVALHAIVVQLTSEAMNDKLAQNKAAQSAVEETDKIIRNAQKGCRDE